MKIKALQPFSTGDFSMEQYEVREVTDTLGNQLIAAGVAIEIGGGGTGGGVLVVTETVSGDDYTLSATYKQIVDAGFCVLDEEVDEGLHSLSPLKGYSHEEGFGYTIVFLGDNAQKAYIAETENAYPVYNDGK